MKEGTARRVLNQRRKAVDRQLRHRGAVDFFNILTGPLLYELVEEQLPAHRERLYPPTVALSLFVRQVLSTDGSCRHVVDGWAAQRALEGVKDCGANTGGYSQARQRLPLEMVKTLAVSTGEMLSGQSPSRWCWRGRRVKLVDGTGVSMPDTVSNRACYPQPAGQAPGVGYPQARLVAMICLSSGAIADAAIGPLFGEGSGEQGLLRRMLPSIDAGDVVLADAMYCDYWLMASLQAAGVDVLVEQNGSRVTDFRCGRRLGVRDHVVTWRKPPRPRRMTPEEYAALPDTLTVREVEAEGRVLVTTMVDRRKSPKGALSQLYAKRWHVELDLRHIKTTLGMEVLRCKSAPMIEKEIWVHLLAYNLIRLLMAQAAIEAGVTPRELSFKHTVQLWTHWVLLHAVTEGEWQHETLFLLIAQVRVGNRPGRREPRARRRRPKPYQWLKVPRDVAKQQITELGYLPNP